VNRTAIRIHQQPGRAVRISVSASDSFDLDGRPLEFSWTSLYANTGVEIEPGGRPQEATITVPAAAELPQGRTVIMLTVNNGLYDSNPAMINVYRPHGKANLRPTLSGLADTAVLSGETVRFEIESEDPERFPVTFYRWANEVGELSGSTFEWKTPRATEPFKTPVSIIASDGTSGFNSMQATISVTPTLAMLGASRTEGPAPLAVEFSSAGSADIDGNALNYSWDFDDGMSSPDRNPRHVFTEPGLHQVTLTVDGPFGSHSVSQVIRVNPDWRQAIDNGWTRRGIDGSVWSVDGSLGVSVQRRANSRWSLMLDPDKKAPPDAAMALTSVDSFAPPLMIETTFKRLSRRKGTGIEVLGMLIGSLEARKSPDTSIGRRLEDETWIFEPITHALARPQTPSTLLVYVTADPNHPGRIRYTGRLDTPLESRYFRLDDQAPSGDKIRILLNSRGGRFEIADLAVFAAGDADGGS
jgi:PKD repeat protein